MFATLAITLHDLTAAAASIRRCSTSARRCACLAHRSGGTQRGRMGQDGSHSQHQAAPTIGTLHPRCLHSASVRVWTQLSPHHAPLSVVGLLAPLSRPGCRHRGRPGAVCQRAAGPRWLGEQLPAADAAQHRRVGDPPELSVAFRTQPARCKPSGCLPQRMPPPARTAFGGAPATGLTRWFWNGKTSGRCAASKTARPTR